MWDFVSNVVLPLVAAAGGLFFVVLFLGLTISITRAFYNKEL